MTLLLFDGSTKRSSSTIITYTTYLAIFLVVASTSVSTENVTSKATSTTPSATPTEITIVNRRTSTISSSDYLAYQQQSYVEKHLPVEGNSPKKHRELVDKQRALEKTNRQRRQSFRKKANGRDQSPGLLTLSFILVRDNLLDSILNKKRSR
ncbi:uncharacterized protein LOC126909692 isoform X1 [Daktulosphaira vitifoliae]|uniref:uncharacterized protein LOC126909692 isoform X1 n=1 Tax=Daktulosphaira vitifoliae TaxID=58002 RepID=UPI0021AACCC2|nr:uncharacterized protein LOC126909692 isoform X1 [Daktulosphaira vitifoliae]